LAIENIPDRIWARIKERATALAAEGISPSIDECATYVAALAREMLPRQGLPKDGIDFYASELPVMVERLRAKRKGEGPLFTGRHAV
jgi:hypothetical protein